MIYIIFLSTIFIGSWKELYFCHSYSVELFLQLDSTLELYILYFTDNLQNNLIFFLWYTQNCKKTCCKQYICHLLHHVLLPKKRKNNDNNNNIENNILYFIKHEIKVKLVSTRLIISYIKQDA